MKHYALILLMLCFCSYVNGQVSYPVAGDSSVISRPIPTESWIMDRPPMHTNCFDYRKDSLKSTLMDNKNDITVDNLKKIIGEKLLKHGIAPTAGLIDDLSAYFSTTLERYIRKSYNAGVYDAEDNDVDTEAWVKMCKEYKPKK